MTPPTGSWRDNLSPLILLSNNWISRIGVLLVTTAGVLWLFLLPTYLKGEAGSAYIGILLFLILPMFFFAGLALIPAGILLRKRKLGPGARMRELIGIRSLSWQNPEVRRLVTFVAAATFVNIGIGSNLTYRAVEHLDSAGFCGTSCHVMKPEYTAYQVSPHSRVPCVKCHVGPGASGFVESKLAGVHQVVAITFNTYQRPIPVPIPNLRPARETCEGCHWPGKYGADRVRVIPHFNDEGVRSDSVLLMRIGGGSASGYGIHTGHVGEGIKVRYAHTDQARQTIPWVEYSRNGAKKEFFAPKTTAADVAKMDIREMDCMDCHTRPSHSMQLPERAMDDAMAAGTIPPSLPQIRKIALETLKKDYTSEAQAEKEVPAAILKFYKDQLPEVAASRTADVERSAEAVLGIWKRNIFPEMKITWGTYVNNVGHTDSPGCFRCHDEEHKTSDGASAIGQDCNGCHVLLAMEEEKPKILTDLGLRE
ncbi:MAG: NapC/NirT family cytochrome c [Bryobacteraceae bacterium]